MTFPVRRFCLLTCAILTLALGACGRWVETPLADGAFVISAPPGVTFKCHDQTSLTGQQIHLCNGETSSIKLLVLAQRLAGPSDNAQAQTLIASMVSILSSASSGKVVSSKDIEVGGAPGKDFVIANPHAEETERILIGHGYVVIASAFPKNKEALKEDIQRFVTSLHPIAH